MAGDTTGLKLNSDCIENVLTSHFVSMIIPQRIFSEQDPETEINIFFALFQYPSLFPYGASDNTLSVNSSVVGITIANFNTDKLSENITIQFFLDHNVSLTFP